MTRAPATVSERQFAFPRNRVADISIVARNDASRTNEPFIPTEAQAWLLSFIEEIEQLIRLPRGWDSNGALPPDSNTALGALELIYSLAQLRWSQPTVTTATRSGGIQFEWGNHDSIYFELECVSRDTAEYFFSDKTRHIEKEGIVHSGESLGEIASLIRHAQRFSRQQ